MAAVELKNVTKRWKDFVAVDDLSLIVHDREFLALLGPSGCGKTTALRMIAGLEEPSSGTILIGDEDVTHHLPKDRNVAMVFQNYGLYPHMKVGDNIGYPLKIRGIPEAERRRLIAEAAKKARIGELLERHPRQLSGGQRQRVALARAIVRTPRLFLMDEPLSNLDALLRASMRAELQHLSRELQITTVYVTHDQAEAMTLANRVAVMSGGKIRQLGSPEEIYDDPAEVFVAGFIGSPPMNMIPGRIEAGDFFVGESAWRAVAKGSHSDAIIGVRAEDTQVTTAGGGVFDAPVYAYEKTGDSVLITVEIGDRYLTAKAQRDARPVIGEKVGVSFEPEKTYWFNQEDGYRLRQLEIRPGG